MEINPILIKKFSEATTLRKTKTDKVDTAKIANMNSESYKKMVSKLRRTISYAKFCKLKELAKNTIGSEDDFLVYELQIYLDIYSHLDSKIKDLESIIVKYYSNTNSHIHTIKGISMISAACIYSEYGGVLNFHTPNQMLAFAGLEPSSNQSGEQNNRGYMVKHGSSYLRYVLLNSAQLIITHNSTFYDYYLKKRNEGKHHRVALSHVARKLIRIIFHLEKNNIDFNSNKLR